MKRQHQAEQPQELEGALRYVLFAMESVLCNPEGEPCFHGSDGDRQVIRQAMYQAKAAIAAMGDASKRKEEGTSYPGNVADGSSPSSASLIEKLEAESSHWDDYAEWPISSTWSDAFEKAIAITRRHYEGRPAAPGKPLELQTRDELLAYIRHHQVEQSQGSLNWIALEERLTEFAKSNHGLSLADALGIVRQHQAEQCGAIAGSSCGRAQIDNTKGIQSSGYPAEKDPRENCQWKCRLGDARCLCQKWARASAEPSSDQREMRLPFDEISIDVSTNDFDAGLRAFASLPPVEIMENKGKRVALFEGYLNEPDVRQPEPVMVDLDPGAKAIFCRLYPALDWEDAKKSPITTEHGRAAWQCRLDAHACLDVWSLNERTVSLAKCSESVKQVFDLSLVGPDSGFKPDDVAKAVLDAAGVQYVD